jgi:hypothetical protein
MQKQDRTQPTTAVHPAPASVNFAKLVVSEYVEALRQSFDRPLNALRDGATVTATVTVYSMRPVAGGRASGVITGAGGSAIASVPREQFALHAEALTPGTEVTIRGFVDIVAGIPTIRVLSAKAVA